MEKYDYAWYRVLFSKIQISFSHKKTLYVKSIHLALAKLKCTFVLLAMLSHFTRMRGKIEWALWLRFRLGGSACSNINSKGKEKTTKFRNISDNSYLD